MKKLLLVVAMCAVLLSCGDKQNPLLGEWKTPHQVPPFNKIKIEHYLPAFEAAMLEHNAEIEAIVSNEAEPTFENTIAALDYSGMTLTRVENVFYNLNSADTNDEMQALAKKVSPLLSKHYDEISLNPDLFERVKFVWDNTDQSELTTEQAKVLEKVYKGFVRSGANLPQDKKEELKKINEELSLLTLQFGENVLAETNAWHLTIEDEADLAGLPESLIAAAAQDAKAAGEEGKWVFTLHKPSWIPFLTYADNRDLREKIYKAMYMRADNDNEHDNKEIIAKIVNLRIKRAEMLGYETHADYMLEERMAKEPKNVYDLLNQLWDPALTIAKKEVYDMQEIIDAEGGDFRLQSWDWWYYAEKVRQAKYDLSEEALKPYFKLENVRDGVFDVSNKLFGLQFRVRKDIPVYHPDAEVFEVLESDGTFVGILYMDYYTRASKRGGAWCTNYGKQYKKDGELVTPNISIVCNFPKPTGDTPSLISFDNANTLFHEFGHALHGLLSNSTYPSVTGTSVPRDFVELPSQIMENWCGEPEVLKSYAKHYETGEVIPDDLIEKMENSSKFNQGFATVEYLAASFLDMDYHTLAEETEIDPRAFEKASMDNIGLIDEIIPRYRSGYFQHIFAGGYSSGYYSYIWAEVLDADAFQAFKETSLFDQETATSFRENILEKGGSDDAMTLYVNFRGKEPSIEPLLENRGLK